MNTIAEVKMNPSPAVINKDDGTETNSWTLTSSFLREGRRPTTTARNPLRDLSQLGLNYASLL
jgi:hypothetical protein